MFINAKKKKKKKNGTNCRQYMYNHNTIFFM